jgi:AAA domain
MRLVSARVEGFQSFSDSGEVAFSEGINLLIGQNNAGKSAFLRALLPTLADDRHRTSDRWQEHRLPSPKVSFVIEASGAEVADWILRSPSGQLIPMPHGSDPGAYIGSFFCDAGYRVCCRADPGNNI